MKTSILPLRTILTALAATTAAATAAPGALDPTFGAGGKITSSYGANEQASALAIAADGKIVIAGNTTVQGSLDIAVVRYNANGTLDTTFSGDGGTLTDFGTNSLDNVTSVAVQRDGKIVVGGYTDAVGGAGTSDFMLVRYNVDGSLDTFFGKLGKVTRNNSANEQGLAVRVQADGKIVLVGATHIGNNSDFAILRFNADGTQDNTFNSDGLNSTVFGAVDVADSADCFAIQPDGKYVLAGYTSGGGQQDFAIMRFTKDGDRDYTFNGTAEQIVSFGANDYARGIAIQPDGKIVVGGYAEVGGDSQFTVARLTASGTLDNTFSGDGKANMFFGGLSTQQSTSLALQSDGKIVLSGYTDFPSSANFGIMRFNADGTLDSTFDTDGKVTTDIGSSSFDLSYASALQPDGRLVVAGLSSSDFALARYSMTTRADARVGADSKTTTGNNIYNTTGASQTQNLTVKNSGGKKTSYVSIQNDGDSSDSFTVLASPSDKKFTVRYFNGSTDVTTKVTGGTLNTGNISPGAAYLIKVEVTARTKKANSKTTFSITGKSVTDTNNKDTVLIKAKSN